MPMPDTVPDKPQWPFLLKASALVVALLLVAAVLDPKFFSETITDANHVIDAHFGQFYLWFALIVTVAFIGLGLSPWGGLRIGEPGDKPQYSFWSWFAMIFSAGMGSGFMFWGAAEPLYHYLHPPYAGSLTPAEQSGMAFGYTFFHWGLSPWAIYGLTAVAMGYFSYNCKRGFRFSSFLVRDDDYTPAGVTARNGIDLMTALAIIFGVAATLGMAVLNIEGGFKTLLHTNGSAWMEAGIMGVIAVMFIWSAMRGIDSGVKFLSNLSMGVSIVMLVYLLLVGPQWEIFTAFWQGCWMYLTGFLNMSLGIGHYNDSHWVGAWTVKYWSWWIAWAPFVGVFLVLISRGRTIREIMLASIIAPTLFSCLWFSVFGQAAIHWFTATGATAASLDFNNVDSILYRVLEAYFHTPLITAFCMLLIALFVGNSADSATYTIACLSEGDMSTHPRKSLLLAWGFLFFALTMTLLLAGGIMTLNEITAVTVLPFTFLLVAVFASFFRALWCRDAEATIGGPEGLAESLHLPDCASASGKCPDPSP